MAKREKKVIISGVTRESADEAFAIYAKADAQSMKIIADIELYIQQEGCEKSPP